MFEACPRCGRSVRLRRDGRLGKHKHDGQPCDGSLRPPEPHRWEDCTGCVALLGDLVDPQHPKVAIAWIFLRTAHALGHPDLTWRPSELEA